MSEHTKEAEGFRDSLGQENPAQDLQKKTIEEVGEANKKAEKDAEKAEKDAEKSAKPEKH